MNLPSPTGIVCEGGVHDTKDSRGEQSHHRKCNVNLIHKSCTYKDKFNEEMTRKVKADLIDQKIIEFEENFAQIEDHLSLV